MKNPFTPGLFARLRHAAAALFLIGAAAAVQAQPFSGYDLVVPLGAPSTLTIVDGTGKTLPSGRSYVIGIEGGLRGCIEFRNWTGTPQYPVTIVNVAGTGRVKITDDIGSPTSPMYDGITLIHCQYVHLRGDNDAAYRYGIEIAKVGRQYAGKKGLNITGTSSYVEASFLEIHHSEFAGIMAKQEPGCNASDAWKMHPVLVWNDIKLHDNYIHDVGGEGMYLGYTFWENLMCSGTKYAHEIHGMKVYYNLVERGAWDGIQIGSSRTGMELHNNVIYGSGGTVGSGESGDTGLGVQIGSGTAGLVYDNIIMKSRGNSINVTAADDTVVSNNLFVGGKIGIFLDNRPAPPPTDPNARQTVPGALFGIYNNTFINPSMDAIRTYSEVTVNEIYNNIAVVPDTAFTYIQTNGPSVVISQSNNVFQRDFTNLNFVDSNPLIDEALRDFRITSSSNAVGAGLTLTDVDDDFQRIARPQGGSYDAGFSESGPLSVYLIAKPPTAGNSDGEVTASVIGGTSPYTYAWSTGATSAGLTSRAAGLYKVTVTDAVGAQVERATYLFEGASMGAPVYTPAPNETRAPTFSPAAGTYASSQSVTLASATSGATIRYTLDGTTPTSSSTLYTGAISVGSTSTIRAIAFFSGKVDSVVTSATYFIGSAPSAPTSVVGTSSDRRTYVNWPAVSGANRYYVYRSPTSGGTLTLQAIITTNSYTDYSLVNGTTYYYRVKAASEYGISGYSAEVNATPVAYPGTIGLISPAAWGPTTTQSVTAAGAFNAQGSIVWDSVNQVPTGTSTPVHEGTNTSTTNRYWYIDFGPDFANIRITEMWTRFRPSSVGPLGGFATFWWDGDKDIVNSGTTETRMNFGTGPFLVNDGNQTWHRDRDFGPNPVTPLNRYLIIGSGTVATDRPNEFAFIGYTTTAPAITTQPQSQNVAQGSNATFTVSATGTAPLAYQWRKNGTNISGATNSSYTITNVQNSDAADYSVVVSNGAGSVTSANATLSINIIEILTPAAWGQATGSGFCSAAGAFNEQPTWDAVAGTPTGVSGTPHSNTTTAYSNRYWYVDFGADYAKVRITEMWTRYRPNSSGNFSGFAAVWWDDDIDTTNDGTSAGTMNFQTGQGLPNSGNQLWVRDRNYGIGAPITPPSRYLVFSTGATITDRPNEFAFVGYRVP